MTKNLISRINFLIAMVALTAMVLTAAANGEDLSMDAAKRYLAKSFPDANIESLRRTAMPAVYEVVIDGSIYYLSEDGKFLLAGSLYDLESGSNLTEQAYNESRNTMAEQLAAREAVSYAPEDYQYTIHVFSDVECPSCRNFHSQIEQVNALGIRVRYFLLPFLGDTAYRKAVSVWCADDRNQAMDSAKRGLAIADKQCANPMAENIRIAETLGIKGTPSFLLENGKLLQGYRTPQVLLDEAKQAAQ